MTHQQKIEAIRQKCIEANPEILQIKLGCVVQLTKESYHYNKPVPITSVTPMSDGCWEVPWGCFHPKQEGLKIIGRPIRLADVLLAAREVSERIEGQLFVSDNGMFCIAKVGKSLDGLGYWNLRKDSLDDQSEETIDFIWSLLTPNSSK